MIKIKSTVSSDVYTNPEDVITLKKAFLQKGYYEEPEYGITPYTDKNLFKAIKDFQKDNGLKKDGIVKPDGETIKTLNKQIPSVRSPSMRCAICGGFHGGVKGNICDSCDSKS